MFAIQHQEGTCSTHCAGCGVGRGGKGASRAHKALSLGVEIGGWTISACRAALPLLLVWVEPQSLKSLELDTGLYGGATAAVKAWRACLAEGSQAGGGT